MGSRKRLSDITLLAKITSVLKLDYEETSFKAMNILFKKRKKKKKDILSSVLFVLFLQLH